MSNNFLIGKHGRNYGYCNFISNEIRFRRLPYKNRCHILCCDNSCEDILSDVIIEEITHLQTKSHRGTRCYNKQYRNNYSQYYNSSRATLMRKQFNYNKNDTPQK